MTAQAFGVPVTVFSSPANRFYVVCSASEAAEFLANNWSAKDAVRWAEVLITCDEAAEGKCQSIVARSAFVAALREAGIPVNDSHVLG